jgi:thiamine biosynthesis lipoprotein ApbE/tetratricopeptide (TPR) repeat protein
MRTFAARLFLALPLLLCACGAEERRAEPLRQLSGPTMGSAWSIKWHGGAEPERTKQLIERVLSDVDLVFSNWRADSEIAAFNAHASTEPFSATPLLCDALELALEVARATDGAFDPTVKPLVDLYREQKKSGIAPSAEAVASAKARVDWRRVRRVTGKNRIEKLSPDVAIDLDGLVAGYAADLLAPALAELSVVNFMLDVTGEILCRGVRPDGLPWRIGIVDPDNAMVGAEQSLLVVPIRDRSLCTSGDYRNFVVADGKVTTHVFDPRTGQNPTHGVVSVSVLARSCAVADAVGTALMVTGPDAARGLLKNLRSTFRLHVELAADAELAAWFVLANPDGALHSVPLGWPAAFRVDGSPLPPQQFDDAEQTRREQDLADAQRAYAEAPQSIEAAVWVGRRLGYLGRFREAVAHFTEALAEFPDEPRLLRHRGHRHLSLRDFESARDDLLRASELVRGKPDEVEPDGKPTPGRQPHGTLHYAIHYHLGLAQFCLLDFAAAERAWRDCLAVSNNDESRAAVTHWICSSLFAQQRIADCAPLLASITPTMDVVENRHYLELCLLYRGDLTFEALATRDAQWGSSLAFGAVHYAWRKKGIDAAYAPKSEQEALAQLRAIAQRADWQSFGVIAAEAVTNGR